MDRFFGSDVKIIVNHLNTRNQPIRIQYLKGDQSKCLLSPLHTPGVTKKFESVVLCAGVCEFLGLVAWRFVLVFVLLRSSYVCD